MWDVRFGVLEFLSKIYSIESKFFPETKYNWFSFIFTLCCWIFRTPTMIRLTYKWLSECLIYFILFFQNVNRPTCSQADIVEVNLD